MSTRPTYEARIAGFRVSLPEGWTIEWLDRAGGIARLNRGSDSLTVVVEGAGSEWIVTVRGRRIAVSVLSERERMLADAEATRPSHAGPVDVNATLPGLVVAVRVAEGSEVIAGDPLITIEAMKMQNEVRAPRDGRVVGISVTQGEAVRSGQPLLRIE